MENSISLFHLAQSKMRYAVEAQTIRAGNIANANTPNYMARNTLSFAQVLDRGNFFAKRSGMESGALDIIDDRYNPQTQKPDGNTVSLEGEMVEATKAKTSHEAALAAFKTAMDILRMSAGR